MKTIDQLPTYSGALGNAYSLVRVGGVTYKIGATALGGGSSPTGAAGGVLGGTYPNPTFAVDMATQAELGAHTSNTSNPHGVTAAQVGLGNVNNTSDADKPVSTAQQTALDLKLNAANPSYTGTLTGGTGVVNLGSGQVFKDAAGNVGIGTTTPLTRLHTFGSAAGTPATTGTAATGVSARFQSESVNFDFGTYNSGACFIQPRFITDNAVNFTLVLNPNGGAVLVGPGGFGYGPGSGGTVTQATSKSTAVTLNKPSGRIMMHNASLAAGATVEFSLFNSTMTALDQVIVRPNGYAGYAVEVAYFNAATEVVFRVTNKGATRSDPLDLLFLVLRGSIT